MFTFDIRDKLVVSPCGIDDSIWDPSKDKFLPENYNADNMKGKAICKVALQKHLALSKHASTVVVSGAYIFIWALTCVHIYSVDYDFLFNFVTNSKQLKIFIVWKVKVKDILIYICPNHAIIFSSGSKDKKQIFN